MSLESYLQAVNPGSPKVSIITPSFNQAEYIGETVESILSQTYGNIEYIVVDGQSTDSTLEILEKYRDGISAVISEPDFGQSHAINKGIGLASGEFIGWLNSDDILYNDSISVIVQAFANNQDAEVVYGNVDYGSSTQTINHTIYGSSFEFVDAFRRLSIPMPQQGCFWRRSALVKCGSLDEELHYVLDRDYFIRLADKCSLVYVNKSLGLFRSHPDSKSVLMSLKWSSELIQIYSYYFSSSCICHSIHRYKAEVMAAVFISSAILSIKSSRFMLAIRYFTKALKTDPLLLMHPFFLSRIGFIR